MKVTEIFIGDERFILRDDGSSTPECNFARTVFENIVEVKQFVRSLDKDWEEHWTTTELPPS